MFFLATRTLMALAIICMLAVVFHRFAPAHAQNLKVGALEVVEPFVRAMPGGAQVGAGYLKIRNSGDQLDRLIAVESAAAKSVEIHEMVQDGGVVKMRRLGDGLQLPPNATTELAPSGLHLMFTEPRTPFKLGEVVKATLVFEKAGRIEIAFTVKPMGAR